MLKKLLATRRPVTVIATAIAAAAAVALSPTTASAVMVFDRAELISKENGLLYSFRNNGYNGAVNWGPKTQMGAGWGGVPNSAVYFADLNGASGYEELISKENGLLYSFRNNSSGGGPVSWGPKVQIGGGWGGVPDNAVYFADLSNDMRAELISKENGLLYSFANNGYNSNGTVNWGSKTQIGGGWGGVPDNAVYFADLSGDGRAELISKENGLLYSFANNGYNSNGTVNWGSKTQIGGGWGGVPNSAVYFADVSFDGRAELISKENGLLYSFANNGYNSNGTVNWGSKTQIGGGWGGVPDNAVYFADLH
ncbi:hypothetical protein [Streptomyces sp. NPDC094049]|uniref:hypothetical protein n=1 Tax=Streptomyces sp. NPDC094049 TaxID=3154987 RepID=UPI003331626E